MSNAVWRGSQPLAGEGGLPPPPVKATPDAGLYLNFSMVRWVVYRISARTTSITNTGWVQWIRTGGSTRSQQQVAGACCQRPPGLSRNIPNSLSIHRFSWEMYC